jgi:hypothetical protein
MKFSFVFREKKKEKDREELWKKLEKIEVNSKGKKKSYPKADIALIPNIKAMAYSDWEFQHLGRRQGI